MAATLACSSQGVAEKEKKKWGDNILRPECCLSSVAVRSRESGGLMGQNDSVLDRQTCMPTLPPNGVPGSQNGRCIASHSLILEFFSYFKIPIYLKGVEKDSIDYNNKS